MGAASQISSQFLDTYSLAISLLPRIAFFFAVYLNTRLELLRVGQGVALVGESYAIMIALSQSE
jgi:hypothetical protein